MSETLKDNAAEAAAMGVWGSSPEHRSAIGGLNEKVIANKDSSKNFDNDNVTKLSVKTYQALELAQTHGHQLL